MVKELKNKASQTTADIKTAYKNLSRLVEAASLLIVAYFAGYSAYQSNYEGMGYKVLLVAAVVIGLRGAYEFLRYLTNKDAK